MKNIFTIIEYLPYVLKGIFKEKDFTNDPIIECFIMFNNYWKMIHFEGDFYNDKLDEITETAKK